MQLDDKKYPTNPGIQIPPIRINTDPFSKFFHWHTQQ